MIRQSFLAAAVSVIGAVGLARGIAISADQPTPQGAPAPRRAMSGSGGSRTLLGDGRWLLAGGEGANGPLSSASLIDPLTQTTIAIPAMHESRAWHTATVLADGSVLVIGGMGGSGRALATAERFDPATETWSVIQMPGAAARAAHTATLLTDGRVLVAGGAAEGSQRLPSEVWNLDAGTAVNVPGGQARAGHIATLLADGGVLLSGGTDVHDRSIDVADVFDARTATITPVAAPLLDDGGVPLVAEVRPADGSVDVPLDARVTIRLSHGMRPDSIGEQSVVLSGPDGVVTTRVVAAESGRLIFVWPLNRLAAESTYVLSLNGLADRAGIPLVAAPVTFTTAKAPKPTEAGDLESWVPTGAGDWRTHRPPSPWQSLPALHAEPGVTAVAGQVLTLDGRPLRGVTLDIDDESTRTDDTGRFLLKLTHATAGRRELGIDGAAASRGSATYGFFEYGLTLAPGSTLVLPFTIWMPRLDVAHEVALPSPTTSETVVTTPYIPGLELHLPPKTVVRGEDGKPVTRIGITPIPLDRPPFPLAANVDVPVYFTIQPGSAYVDSAGPEKGAWLVYPNYRHAAAGQIAQFFHYDPEEKDWYVYGVGAVTRDARQIVPAAATRLYEFTGAMINSGDQPPAAGATPGGEGRGEPVDPSTGVFVMQKTDLYLPDVIPLSLTRVYNSGDDQIRPFGRGTTHPYAMFLWSAQQYTEADLVLPDGGKIHYVRITPGTGIPGVVLVHQESQTTSATPTVFYKSTIVWNGRGWNLTLTDGTVYVFGENAPLQAIRDRYGNTVTITREFGQVGRILRVTSPNGRWIGFSYDSDGRISQAADNIGRTVAYTYDGNGNLATVTNAEQGVTTYTYTSSNQLATIKDPRNIVYLTNTYQDRRVISQALADQTATFHFAYTLDGAGAIVQTDVTDPRGNLERLLFNADHYIVSDTEAVGQPEQRTALKERQSGTNFVTARVDSLGRRTEFERDGSGHIVQTTHLAQTPQARSFSFTYEPRFSQMASMTDPLGHVWSASYDRDGRLTAATDPMGRRIAVSMSAAGQVTAITDGLQHAWRFGYSGGDLTSATDPLNAVTSLFVDGAGRVVGIANPLGQTASFMWDRLGGLTMSTDGMGAQTTLTYDGNGNLVAVTDALSHPTRYVYDLFDRLATRTDPLSRSETREYDGNDNVTRVVDRKGQVTTYRYDALDRLSQVTFDDHSTISYAYDAGGRLTGIDDSANGSIVREYDVFDRIIQETTPEGTVAYAYDADDRRTTMTAAGQPTVSYAYDAAHQITGLTQGSAAVGIGYDSVGRRSAVTLPNAIVASYTYDAAARLIGVAYSEGANALGDLSYTLDPTGSPVSIGGSWARTGLPPRLPAASYDEANRVVSWGSTAFVHDLNGNLVNDGRTAYRWNARNLLASMTGSAAGVFQYDAMGRRRSKTTAGQTTTFLYDGLNVVEESTNGVRATMLTGLRLDETFMRTDAGVGVVLADVLGSSVALADASGAVRTQYSYEPFGATSASGAASGNAAQFTGRENDGNGLYYYRSRYYAPGLMRFLSEDPLEFGGGTANLYAYVNNQPTRRKDPLGLYDRNVHDDLTNGIARQVGMCAADAAAIAHADQRVDESWSTSPMPPWNVGARRRYHFADDEQLDRLRDSAFSSGSLTAMGIYLHALQDSYAHQRGRYDRTGEPYGPALGHATKLGGPDNPRDRPDLWRRMSAETTQELSQFHKRFDKCQGR